MRRPPARLPQLFLRTAAECRKEKILHPHSITATDETLNTCNALLISEIAAVETYSQVIGKFDTATADTALERILADHQANVFELHKFISDIAVELPTGCGTWAGFEQALQEADALCGEAEMHGAVLWQQPAKAASRPGLPHAVQDAVAFA